MSGRSTSHVHAGFFVARSPLLPVGGTAPGTVDESVAARIREAIRLSSPDLVKALERNPDDAGALAAWGRYIRRMSRRATPFGVSAGFTVGGIGPETRLHVEHPTLKRHARLDFEYLHELVARALTLPEVRAQLHLTINSAVYRTGERIRTFEVRRREGRLKHRLVSIDVDDALRTALDAARNGVRYDDLVALFVADGYSADEATAYVDDLIGTGVMSHSLEPCITGAEPLGVLQCALEAIDHAGDMCSALRTMRQALDRLNSSAPGSDFEAYDDLKAAADDLGVPYRDNALVQVDLEKDIVGLALAESVCARIAAAVTGIVPLTAAAPGGYGTLGAFKERFVARYETRMVPLMEALDEDRGIRFRGDQLSSEGSPILYGLPLRDRSRLDKNRTESVSDNHVRVLARLILRSELNGRSSVEINDTDIREATGGADSLPLPDAFSVTARFVADPDSPDGLHPIVMQGGGPSGANMMGRFASENDALRDHVLRLFRLEEALQPEALFAEIVHLPQERLANITVRPVLRSHEIEFVGRGSAPHKIAVTDLMLAVENDRLVLRDGRSGREVIPRMTNAHAFGTSINLTVYQFLCRLQQEPYTPVRLWTWGPFSNSAFTPRVIYKEVTICLAKWTFDEPQLAALRAATGVPAMAAAVAALRAGSKLPARVVHGDSDNVLPYDLTDETDLIAFVRAIGKEGPASLAELYPGPDQLPLTIDGAPYVGEYIIPFVRGRPSRRNPEPFRRVSTATRSFGPGSEWVYAKYYCGFDDAEKLLLEQVAPIAQAAVATGEASNWFFVRYSDPEWHLRVRIRCRSVDASQRVTSALSSLARAAEAAGLVNRSQFDAYLPEVERYGGDSTIAHAEQWFWRDSELAIRLFRLERELDNREDRWLRMIRGVHAILNTLDFPLPRRVQQLTANRDALGRELGESRTTIKWLAGTYRTLRPRVEAVAAGAPLSSVEEACFQEFEAEIRDLIRGQPDASQRLTAPAVVQSLVHMHINRMSRSMGKYQEYVVCDLLRQSYRSVLGRQSHASRAAGNTDSGRGP